MRRYMLLITVFISGICFGQNPTAFSEIDKKMTAIPKETESSTTNIANYINQNVTGEENKIRAAFYWTASNISYDVANMYEPNFIYTPEEKIASALKTKKGVCIHYAEVFKDIANQLGIKTVIISGYTKQYGKVATISHAWVASKVDGKWQLFDPTWAAGYVDGQKFVKKFNNSYYKVPASKHISSHMPFDYMWQFLSSPITNNEFISGKPAEKRPLTNYDFSAEIEKYEKLPQDEQAFETAQRVEKNGIINDLTAGYLANKKNEFTVLRQNQNIYQLNAIVANFNEAVVLFNDFVQYRNNRFKPAVSDEELTAMIQNPLVKLKKCQNDIYKIGTVGKENTASVNSLKKAIIETVKQAEEHDAFVKEYLSKSQSQRKSMFTKKVSWMGIPLR